MKDVNVPGLRVSTAGMLYASQAERSTGIRARCRRRSKKNSKECNPSNRCFARRCMNNFNRVIILCLIEQLCAYCFRGFDCVVKVTPYRFVFSRKNDLNSSLFPPHNWVHPCMHSFCHESVTTSTKVYLLQQPYNSTYGMPLGILQYNDLIKNLEWRSL